MTALKDALTKIASYIKDTAADESEPEWIACHVVGCGRAALRLKREIDDDAFAKMIVIAKERATGRPLSQVLGYTGFCGLEIKVTSDVLTPRPETELLAEQAILFLKDRKNARALDLCTGSGCIAVTLALSVSAEIVASDLSEKALETARGNAALNGAKVCFVLSDAFEKVDGKFDLIVSNPPYIPTAEIESLDREVRDFEPRMALDGGSDGLDFYRRIAAGAAQRLTEGGALMLECGEGQAEKIIAMLGDFDCTTVVDYRGVERIVKAVKKSV